MLASRSIIPLRHSISSPVTQRLPNIMSDGIIKLKPTGSTYGVIHRLGLKYVPPAFARPIFACEATTAKLFWDKMFNIFDNYRQTMSDQLEARQNILNLVDQYGPHIWGVDRVNVVSYPFGQYPEYHKDLYWDNDPETQQL